MAALIARAPGADRCCACRCGGPRGHLARRRRRGPEGLSAASGAKARNVSRKARLVICRSCAASGSPPSARGAHPGATASRPGAFRAPLRMYRKSYKDLPGCKVRLRLMIANLPGC
jgi:hypothetical protein